MDNVIVVSGSAGRDAELSFTASGSAVCKFSLAVSRRWQKDGNWSEETTWINCVAFGQLAENSAETILKGTRCTVNGRLSIRQYETQDGEKKTSTELVADDVAVSLRFATAQVVRNERVNANSESY